MTPGSSLQQSLAYFSGHSLHSAGSQHFVLCRSSVSDHVGGWKLELWDQSFQLAFAWDNSSHWGCDADGTARWANIQLPSQSCTNCTLRLLRQAMDKSFGDNFTYVSCSAVNVVTSTVDCNGCNGHGSCVKVSHSKARMQSC